MSKARNGKIARLPKGVREELNRRLDDGAEGRPLVAWLNGLPAVKAQAKLAARPGSGTPGKLSGPITEQNLSDWRQGGYQDWLRLQEALVVAREMKADTGKLQPAAEAESLADRLAVWLTARYLVAIRRLGDEEADGEPDVEVLRKFSQEVVALRRGDHSARRLKLLQTRLDQDVKETAEGVIELFNRWKKDAKVRLAVYGKPLSPEEKDRRMLAVFGLTEWPAHVKKRVEESRGKD